MQRAARHGPRSTVQVRVARDNRRLRRRSRDEEHGSPNRDSPFHVATPRLRTFVLGQHSLIVIVGGYPIVRGALCGEVEELNYCARDTWAMVKVVERLRELAG